MRGVWVLVAALVVTALWALFESRGFNFWAFEARVVAPMFLAGVALLLTRFIPAGNGAPADAHPHFWAGAALMVGFVGFIVAMFFPHGVIHNPQPITKGVTRAATMATDGQWLSYSRTGEATRFAPFDQINPGNVGELEQVWAVHSGDIAEGEPVARKSRTRRCMPMAPSITAPP